MQTTVSSKGQTVIPEAIREQARLQPGDRLDVGYINGLVILRKQTPLTPTQARSLILGGKSLPEITQTDESEVVQAIKSVRGRRRQP